MKLECLRTFTDEHNVDIMAITEMNVTWDKLEYKDRIQAKTRGMWEGVPLEHLSQQTRQIWK